jgi:hypothetical protein
MKIRVMIAVIVCLVATTAEAQTDKWAWVEGQCLVQANEAGETKATPCFGVVTANIQKNAGLGFLIQSGHGNEWRETVIGPSVKFGSETLFSVGFGIEHDKPNHRRARLALYWDDEETGSFIYIEADSRLKNVDEDGFDRWINVEAVRMFNEKFGVGIFAEMPDTGIGPKIEYRPHEKLGIWAFTGYDWQAKKIRGGIGLRLMFESK